jgi:hypothetical protein
MTTHVVNLRKEAFDVYIGRPGKGQAGPFGNPIAVGQTCPVCGLQHTTPGSTLVCFKVYFLKRVTQDPAFRNQVLALKDKTLGCFCKPKPCHGDIIAAWLDEED